MWVLVLKRGKVKSRSLNHSDRKLMETTDEEGYQYLGILEYDRVKENEMKTEFVREYKRRIWLILKHNLNGENKIEAINTWAVAILR